MFPRPFYLEGKGYKYINAKMVEELIFISPLCMPRKDKAEPKVNDVLNGRF